MLGDHDYLVINADVIERAAGRRPVRWGDRQGARYELFPLLGVAALGGVHHAPQHGAVWVDPGRHDPHQTSVILPAARPCYGAPEMRKRRLPDGLPPGRCAQPTPPLGVWTRWQLP